MHDQIKQIAKTVYQLADQIDQLAKFFEKADHQPEPDPEPETDLLTRIFGYPSLKSDTDHLAAIRAPWPDQIPAGNQIRTKLGVNYNKSKRLIEAITRERGQISYQLAPKYAQNRAIQGATATQIANELHKKGVHVDKRTVYRWTKVIREAMAYGDRHREHEVEQND